MSTTTGPLIPGQLLLAVIAAPITLRLISRPSVQVVLLPQPLLPLALMLLFYALTLLLLELHHRLRPASPLQLLSGDFDVSRIQSGFRIQGTISLHNPHPRMEVFVPELRLETTLLGQGDLGAIKVSSRVSPAHPDAASRSDGYWVAYIIKAQKSTSARIELRIEAAGSEPIERLDTVWLQIHWVNYGPFGRLWRRDAVLIPLARPATSTQLTWRPGDGCSVLPLRTHLLGVLDEPLQVLQDYAGVHLQCGDLLTIGETPLAVMQGRYHHPATVEPSPLALMLCRVFHPTSSLATACGLQSLIDLEGPARILNAWLLGSLLKLLGFKGWFYRLAGEQARLIDDVTGTTPPYDQTIVLGPERTMAFCERAAAALGIGVAIVDVNDLGRVKVLAASQQCDQGLLQRALRPNPAGNADERTPLVLIRPA